MANREQKGNKEKRKPKVEKPKAPAQLSTFRQPASAADKSKTSGKKG